MLGDVLADRLEQVGLAEAGPAVDEERVVRLRGSFRDGQRRRVREAVRGADDEGVERVLRLDRGRGGRLLRRLFQRPGALDVVVDRELDAALLAGRVAHGGADQVDEVPFDPLAREVVRDREDEGIVVQLTPF